MDETEKRSAPVRRRRAVATVAGGVVAGGLVLGITVFALSAAGAQAPTPSPGAANTPSEKPWPGETKGQRPGRGQLGHGFPGPGRLGGLGFGKFAGPGIHGELTTKKPGGGYQTLAMQAGEVTSVSSSSVAVKSEDGFTRTYSVDGKTRVMPGKNGISDVKKGDRVRVLAVVEGDKARSLHIVDASSLQGLREKLPWKPGQGPPPNKDA